VRLRRLEPLLVKQNAACAFRWCVSRTASSAQHRSTLCAMCAFQDGSIPKATPQMAMFLITPEKSGVCTSPKKMALAAAAHERTIHRCSCPLLCGAEDWMRSSEREQSCGQSRSPVKLYSQCHQHLRVVQEIAGSVPGQVFDAYMDARDNIREGKQAEEHQKEMADLEERIRKEAGQQVRPTRNLIIERILTPKCPKGLPAFLDFEGCMALTCRKCKCHFCAICLKDCV
jgi:hypothetical protein